MQGVTPTREPMFNVPPVVVATLAVLALVHAVRSLVLSPQQDLQVLLLFAFIPARYDPSMLPGGTFPGGLGADIWTFVTYALIHGDFTHLLVNAVWLLPFGTAVARRFGAARFLAFCAVTAAAGAALHLVTHAGEILPMIGASAAISGMMAAAMRFAFQHGGPLGMWRADRAQSYHAPAAPLLAALRDPRVFAFVAVWFGLNALLGLGSISITGAEQAIAWQAHIGGFLAGLVLFALFDPVPKPVPSPGPTPP
jgi:membrane associated rhomboid family serine protease